ncbi:trypsin-like serine protease [Hujiaoplasma nucleasis]|uniref:Trypsin-like serine protease n=1 Tax=Hujiaoplasma nucleasis TaxID=2725268 RepID=A0A7L6N507_9MOLU|nr:trypsin-like peptidase domain-containing protein [Hujiaoplasma nucleasis]QLY39659.1 trypsin-like serine protease [Hujiaoplasma nucleasis]
MTNKKIKSILLILTLFFTLFMGSCSYFIPQTNQQILNATYSGEFYSYEDYSQLPIYVSETYSLNSIDQYNQILLNTKEHVVKSTISIKTTISTGFNDDIISGSGFIYQADESYYYAVTNHHVIENSNVSSPSFATIKFEVKTYEDTSYHEAEVLISNKDLDLAILRFEKNNRQSVEFINISQRLGYRMKADELVMAVGNPLRFYNNVSIGKFVRISLIENVDFIVIEHNAEIDEGSSGGALVDVDGNLIGINTWGSDDGTKSFAIPSFVLYNFISSNNLINE